MKTKEERIHHHMYETLEGIKEHAERIVALEDLVAEYGKVANYLCERWDECEYCELGCFDKRQEKCKLGRLNDRMREMGIEVEPS